MSGVIMDEWRRDAHPYIVGGLRCELWGVKVGDMGRDDLIAFIGFLDEVATERGRRLGLDKKLVPAEMREPLHPVIDSRDG